MKKRLLLSLTAIGLAATVLAAPASADFGLKDLDVTFEEENGGPAMQAGSHPFALTIALGFHTRPDKDVAFEIPDGSPRDLTIALPPGLVGNPNATGRCTTLDFLQKKCPLGTQVGIIDVTFGDPGKTETYAVRNLTPPPGVPAKLGFIVENVVPVTVEVGVNPNSPYNLRASLANIPQAVPFYGSVTRIWGNPADPAHDSERVGCGGNCSAGLGQLPFVTSPRACEGLLPTFFEADSWEIPGVFDRPPPVLTDSGFVGCEKLGFSAGITAQTTSKAASAPSGLDISLEIENEGLLNPTGSADSDLKKLVLTFPEGVTANPALAEGLSTCSPAAFAAEAVNSSPGQGCPEASKIGSLEVETPLLEGEILGGQIFIASQGDNPFGSLLALYLVIKDPELGILVKAAGKVEPDPQTGQLTAIFGEPGHELPQFPVSSVRSHLREGGRSPLITPSLCGTYETRALLTPWANPSQPLSASASFEITQGVNGAPCAGDGTPPFEPGFEAGTLNNQAKAYSPFVARLTRRDGDQDLTKFSFKLPPGLVGSVAGVGKCSDAAIAAARTKTGGQELDSPSCPADSEIGKVLGGAGVGAQLAYVPGKLYMAGPIGGNPLSIVSIVPAVAGPFDIGNVVTRVALTLNPVTAQVEVDGANSEPIPHILAGIPLRVRDVRVNTDRPKFTLNPTNCKPFATIGLIWGGGSAVFSTLDDLPVPVSDRFQAANCAGLGFKPRIKFTLTGGTSRGDHPALKTVVTPRPDDANFGRAVVTLPRSAFLDQAHIRTVCTRVQFAAEACPPGAVYGSAKAWSPLLDEPAEGPVYLRSSNNKLPDLVMALKGPPAARVDVELTGRIDSHKGGIRASFEAIPDVPVSRFVLAMQGGKKGLIVNSRNLCAAKSRATARLTGQNGRRYNFRPLVKASSC